VSLLCKPKPSTVLCARCSTLSWRLQSPKPSSHVIGVGTECCVMGRCSLTVTGRVASFHAVKHSVLCCSSLFDPSRVQSFSSKATKTPHSDVIGVGTESCEQRLVQSLTGTLLLVVSLLLSEVEHCCVLASAVFGVFLRLSRLRSHQGARYCTCYCRRHRMLCQSRLVQSLTETLLLVV
jgi:hypothetical protein